jgi:hypothetical protein
MAEDPNITNIRPSESTQLSQFHLINAAPQDPSHSSPIYLPVFAFERVSKPKLCKPAVSPNSSIS